MALKVFPNPSNGVFFIQHDRPGACSISLFDVFGKAIAFDTQAVVGNITHLKVFGLQGIAILQISQGKKHWSERLSVY